MLINKKTLGFFIIIPQITDEPTKLGTKGQLISEWLFDVLNFPKKNDEALPKNLEIGQIGKIKVLLYINHVK